MRNLTALPNFHSLQFVEALYDEFRRAPEGLAPEWRAYFEELTAHDASDARPLVAPSFSARSIFNPPRLNGSHAAPGARATDSAAMQHRVDMLIRNYRVRGHMAANIDPLGRPRPAVPELDPQFHGFSAADMDRLFATDPANFGGARAAPLREIIARMHNTYCHSIAAQFMHIDDLSVRAWLQERMEGNENRVKLSRTEQFRILTRLTDAVMFEEFIQKKFIGAKSFSLEGAESLIPLLDLAIDKASEQGIDEIVIGMAHRGRLNVLANILGKSPRQIFREFADLDAEHNIGRGDVKYHMGYHGTFSTASGRSVALALCFNPSHLEFVNPVALGRVRARQDRVADSDRRRGMCVLIHGDAAFIGEGIVQETLNLSELRAYTVGGTLHIIVNNQIGFTTDPRDARSCTYATDVAKMLQIPIFHVNGEDPEAVAAVVRLALEFRQTFRRDVVIDMYCFRRRGHNEQDEPAFTQPLMYRSIAARKSIRESYVEHLAALGDITSDEAEEVAAALHERLEQELSGVHSVEKPAGNGGSPMGKLWAAYRGGLDRETPDVPTAVPRERLAALFDKLTQLPPTFHPHPKTRRLLDERQQMARGEKPLDWGAAEALAFATLATEGARIRMSGQDSGRGTFSHRHAVLVDHETGAAYTPLQHLAPDQGPVEIFNSPLSEAGVMGFEYGYSAACPDGLVLWEAQFGDFVNCAQVIIDQFLTSAEDKWLRLSGLVLLLPHGLEGQGPEHSSARIERFLEVAAENNVQIVVPSTPANYFHVLRRQVVRPWRKPLIVFTPKSLLRNRDSTLDDLAAGGFQHVIPDNEVAAAGVDRIVLSCGKLYHELLRTRTERGLKNVALVRIEQLYPLREHLLAEALSAYRNETPTIWAQEEPENMGAWRYLRYRFGTRLFDRLPLAGVSRRASASPATGSHGSHKIEQQLLINEALGVR